MYRLNLEIDPKPRMQMTIRDFVRPGFFGWGKAGARIELRRVGLWYDLRVRVGNYTWSENVPSLPEEYRRFAPSQ
jgi:hypothetical protein